mmetsp:Transcript_20013/g.62741  ORF Transcript_20013/g.62741 Transcript_20013/m.62741 type:complete len:269 (-) Transcript_20013:977-1783(-)
MARCRAKRSLPALTAAPDARCKLVRRRQGRGSTGMHGQELWRRQPRAQPRARAMPGRRMQHSSLELPLQAVGGDLIPPGCTAPQTGGTQLRLRLPLRRHRLRRRRRLCRRSPRRYRTRAMLRTASFPARSCAWWCPSFRAPSPSRARPPRPSRSSRIYRRTEPSRRPCWASRWFRTWWSSFYSRPPPSWRTCCSSLGPSPPPTARPVPWAASWWRLCPGWRQSLGRRVCTESAWQDCVCWRCNCRAACHVSGSCRCLGSQHTPFTPSA